MTGDLPDGPTEERYDAHGNDRVGGPVASGWREVTLTRAKELAALSAWASASCPRHDQILANAVARHLEAARDAAQATAPLGVRPMRPRNGALHERATSNLDAAEAQLLNIAGSGYVLGQLPALLNHVQRHLVHTDPRRLELERLAQQLGVPYADHPSYDGDTEANRAERLRVIDEERGRIVTAVRGASSAALREQTRVRSFRNVLVVTTAVMSLLAISLALVGALRPTLLPLCFAPEEAGRAIVVCPTAQSSAFAVSVEPSTSQIPSDDVDDAVRTTVTGADLFIVELVGLAAAAVAAAAAIHGIRGSSEPYGLPVALAVLKLPTGALTALLGLLLMRGQFIPGLSALDSSAQILAWALVFGYAQQLLTRLVDHQGQNVLASVRGADPPRKTRQTAADSRLE